jgi:hypothetical protein
MMVHRSKVCVDGVLRLVHLLYMTLPCKAISPLRRSDGTERKFGFSGQNIPRGAHRNRVIRYVHSTDSWHKTENCSYALQGP